MSDHLETSKSKKKQRGFPGAKNQCVVTEKTHVSKYESK